jgi:hypothetical protein
MKELREFSWYIIVGVQESCARGKHRMPRWMHKNAASSQSETFKYIILVLYRAFLRSGHCHDKNDTRNILWLVPKLLQRRQTSDSTLAFWKFNLHPGTRSQRRQSPSFGILPVQRRTEKATLRLSRPEYGLVRSATELKLSSCGDLIRRSF